MFGPKSARIGFPTARSPGALSTQISEPLAVVKKHSCGDDQAGTIPINSDPPRKRGRNRLGTPAGFPAEGWPDSRRNRGRFRLGMVAELRRNTQATLVSAHNRAEDGLQNVKRNAGGHVSPTRGYFISLILKIYRRAVPATSGSTIVPSSCSSSLPLVRMWSPSFAENHFSANISPIRLPLFIESNSWRLLISALLFITSIFAYCIHWHKYCYIFKHISQK